MPDVEDDERFTICHGAGGEGYHAKDINIQQSDNPYPEGSEDHEFWDVGWRLRKSGNI